MLARNDVELNAKTILTELRGLLSGNTAEFGQFLIQKSKEWNMPVKRLLKEFEKLGEEFSGKKNTNKELYVSVKKYIDNPIPAYTKTLNSEDAEKLVSIIAKHVDVDAVEGMTGIEFAHSLFEKMDLDEITTIEGLLIGGDLSKVSPSEIASLCVKGMIRNNLLDLLRAYKQGLDK